MQTYVITSKEKNSLHWLAELSPLFTFHCITAFTLATNEESPASRLAISWNTSDPAAAASLPPVANSLVVVSSMMSTYPPTVGDGEITAQLHQPPQINLWFWQSSFAFSVGDPTPQNVVYSEVNCKTHKPYR